MGRESRDDLIVNYSIVPDRLARRVIGLHGLGLFLMVWGLGLHGLAHIFFTKDARVADGSGQGSLDLTEAINPSAYGME